MTGAFEVWLRRSSTIGLQRAPFDLFGMPVFLNPDLKTPELRFGQFGRIPVTVRPLPPHRVCNRHDDCNQADIEAKARGSAGSVHCWDEDCPDCFPS